VPCPLARARAPPARRAVQRARRRGHAVARPGARRARSRVHVRRPAARARTARTPRLRPAVARMTYLADVGALARKDLLLELRARDTLPAMLLFVVST